MRFSRDRFFPLGFTRRFAILRILILPPPQPSTFPLNVLFLYDFEEKSNFYLFLQ